MRIFIPVFLALSLVSWFWDSDEKKTTVTLKETMVEKKWFRNDNTFIIICRGWPNESLKGKAKVDSAKEAALINAQFTLKDLFDKSIDVVKNGIIEKYNIHDDFVTIEYSISYKGLRKYYKENKK